MHQVWIYALLGGFIWQTQMLTHVFIRTHNVTTIMVMCIITVWERVMLLRKTWWHDYWDVGIR